MRPEKCRTGVTHRWARTADAALKIDMEAGKEAAAEDAKEAGDEEADEEADEAAKARLDKVIVENGTEDQAAEENSGDDKRGHKSGEGVY